MDFRLSPREEKFSKEVHSFLRKEATPELLEEISLGAGYGPLSWRFIRKLGEKRWLTPMLPLEYGGLGASHMQRQIIRDEICYFFPEMMAMVGAQIVAPVVMAVGSEEQKKEYVPRISRGEIEFALGYTEPEAGSDLANIQIEAEEREDCYVVNGQKMFNTASHYAHYHWLCARTAVIEPKHKGLSLFIVPLDSPGISLIAMWTVSGERTNSVFYDNVKVPKKNLVGEKNRGFYHMASALEHERMFPVGQLRRAIEDLTNYVKTTKRDGKVLAQDPLIQRTIAELAIEVEVAQWLAYRLVWLVENGKPTDYEAPVEKLFATELQIRLGDAGLSIMGQYGVLCERSKHSSSIIGWLEHWFLTTARQTISAGASEIQRNIIATRGLGLPRG